MEPGREDLRLDLYIWTVQRYQKQQPDSSLGLNWRGLENTLGESWVLGRSASAVRDVTWNT